MIINVRLTDKGTEEFFTASEFFRATFELIPAIIIEGYKPEINPIIVANSIKYIRVLGFNKRSKSNR